MTLFARIRETVDKAIRCTLNLVMSEFLRYIIVCVLEEIFCKFVVKIS